MPTVVFSTVKFTTAVSVFRNSGLNEKAEQIQNLDHQYLMQTRYYEIYEAAILDSYILMCITIDFIRTSNNKIEVKFEMLFTYV